MSIDVGDQMMGHCDCQLLGIEVPLVLKLVLFNLVFLNSTAHGSNKLNYLLLLGMISIFLVQIVHSIPIQVHRIIIVQL